jgi:hypothetical protein
MFHKPLAAGGKFIGDYAGAMFMPCRGSIAAYVAVVAEA